MVRERGQPRSRRVDHSSQEKGGVFAGWVGCKISKQRAGILAEWDPRLKPESRNGPLLPPVLLVVLKGPFRLQKNSLTLLLGVWGCLR